MKIVVIGGSGLIGAKLVARLTELGHEAIPASPSTGVDTLTGAGLDEVLDGAQVVVDVANSPSFADEDVLNFFRTSTRNLLKAASGVSHYVALSVVGSDELPDSGYLRAKVAQENLIKESGLPYSIVRATQFFEFVEAIAGSATDGDTVRLPGAGVQPMASDDVVAGLSRVVVGEPLNGLLEIGGPERFGMDELVRTGLAATGDPRAVVTDSQAPYFGTVLQADSLVPGPGAWLGEIRFADWLAKN
jgi:uncharacterized protein YbjT (DUF2867 family)